MTQPKKMDAADPSVVVDAPPPQPSEISSASLEQPPDTDSQSPTSWPDLGGMAQTAALSKLDSEQRALDGVAHGSQAGPVGVAPLDQRGPKAA